MVPKVTIVLTIILELVFFCALASLREFPPHSFFIDCYCPALSQALAYHAVAMGELG